MKTTWKIPDFIDLEYFFHRDMNADTDSGQNEIRRRDREIYLDHIYPAVEKLGSFSRRAVIKQWLEIRKKQEKDLIGPEAVLPGTAFQEINRLFLYVLAVFGFMGGTGVAFSLLTYRGAEPLNVAVYFGTLVASQIILLTLFLFLFLWRHALTSSLRSSIVYGLISRLFTYLVLKIKNQALKKIPRAQIESVRSALGMISSKKHGYGSLFYWPVFIVAQVFGVFFNIGALSATLMKVLGSDIAFGWQSTVQFSPEFVYRIIKWIALPWAWIVPNEIAYPTLTQVVGSRIILKDGMYHLATQDLVAWWPFLCLSLLTYGLFPRLALLVTGFAGRNLSLIKQDLSNSACDQLISRLETPRISTSGESIREDINGDIEAFHKDEKSTGSMPLSSQDSKTRIIALIHDDIFDDVSGDELKTAIERNIGHGVHEKIRIGEDREADKQRLAELTQGDWKGQDVTIVFIQEAWLPPIREIISFIKYLRQMLGEKAKIIVGLTGKPGSRSTFTPVQDSDWNVWKKQLNIMGDPYLRMERMAVNEG